MPYEAMGDAETGTRILGSAPILGLALGHKSDEIAVTVEVRNTNCFFTRREVKGSKLPRG